ncbi:MAG: LacI family DNA-binding transcriptional regulator [Actinobacteria bacterium]|nr:LacI family DNA-binding transcriptional regulator [Actinomycetota bacterium]
MTLEDVAKLSGVSTATVSRVFSGATATSAATRERVLRAAELLDYRPNTLARALAKGLTQTVGLLVPATTDPFWGEVAMHIEELASREGLAILLASSRGQAEREQEMLRVLGSQRPRGVIIGSPVAPGNWSDDSFRSISLVVIGWDEPVRPEDFDLARALPVDRAIEVFSAAAVPGPWRGRVTLDEIDGSRQAVRHLTDLGHRRIALLMGPPVRPALLRLLGFRAGLSEAGLETDLMAHCEESLEGGRAAALELLAATPRPTAIVAYNDIIATGALRAAHSLGLDVPADISLIGFDDISLAEYLDPPLTTIRQSTAEVAESAFRLLLDSSLGSEKRSDETVATTLVARQSTGAPPAR